MVGDWKTGLHNNDTALLVVFLPQLMNGLTSGILMMGEKSPTNRSNSGIFSDNSAKSLHDSWKVFQIL